MSKKFLIIGLVFLSAGLVATGWVVALEQKQQHRRDFYKSKYQTEADQHIAAYYKWLEQPESERGELPWQLQDNANVKSAARLQTEQQERLIADMDKLAVAGLKEQQLAEVLYGKNWQEKVTLYKNKKKTERSILAASIIVTSFGAMFVLCWVIAMLGRISIAIKKRCKSKTDNAAEISAQAEDELENYEEPLKDLVDCSTDDNEPVEDPNNEPSEQADAPSRTAAFNNSLKRLYMDEDSARHDSDEKSQVSHLSLAEAIRKRMRIVKAKTETNISAASLDGALGKLTEEVAAIRTYASEQQDRVKKLQDGYDWNIIRNFCLRIIRCVDNMDNRIENLAAENHDVTELKEIRDELVFALESSGIEQFAPSAESDYRGQEKIAEAVKDREHTDNTLLSGKIAKVIRYGYRYSIDEDNFKVIRAARVRLFA